MKRTLDEYWRLIKDHSIICAILDPRLKADFIKEKQDRKNAIQRLEQMVFTYKDHEVVRSQPSQSSSLETSSNIGNKMFFYIKNLIIKIIKLKLK